MGILRGSTEFGDSPEYGESRRRPATSKEDADIAAERGREEAEKTVEEIRSTK